MKNFLLFFLFPVPIFAQPTIQWQKSLGGSAADEANSIRKTDDGGYIVTGYAISSNGDVSGSHGIHDFWVVKLSNSGTIEWQKALGGSDLDWANAIRQANDGGYIVAGFTQSTDGDLTGNHGDKDAWAVKLSSTGNIEWQRALGGSEWEEARSIELTSDGGYIMAGQSSSNDGDATGSHGNSLDYWIVKLNSVGVIQWQKALGGSGLEIAHSAKQTSDGGYIVVGEAQSNDGDVSGNNGNIDFWVVKLNNLGDIEWQNPLGGIGWDVGSEIYETADGYIANGYVGSNDGDVTGYQGLFDFWVVKLNKSGDLLWQKTLGGSDADWGYSGTPVSDGGFVIAGTTRSNDGDVLNNDGGQDIWIVKLDTTGEIIWQTILGGSKAENCLSIDATNDGGFVVAGRSSSDDGDATFNHGGTDFWVVKLSPESVGTDETPTSQISPLEIYPNPSNQSITIKTALEEPTLTVIISDLLGREMLHQNIPNGGGVDISSLASGLYILIATEPSGKIFTGKLRKED